MAPVGEIRKISAELGVKQALEYLRQNNPNGNYYAVQNSDENCHGTLVRIRQRGPGIFRTIFPKTIGYVDICNLTGTGEIKTKDERQLPQSELLRLLSIESVGKYLFAGAFAAQESSDYSA